MVFGDVVVHVDGHSVVDRGVGGCVRTYVFGKFSSNLSTGHRFVVVVRVVDKGSTFVVLCCTRGFSNYRCSIYRSSVVCFAISYTPRQFPKLNFKGLINVWEQQDGKRTLFVVMCSICVD